MGVRTGKAADSLGRLGEIAFDQLAIIDGLFVSQLQPDRTSKDRLIELPYRVSPLPLDKQQAPGRCALQIKTVSKAQSVVRASLSSLRRLAQDLEPAVIAIVRLGDDNRLVDVHLVHLFDDVLKRVLHRLREVTRDDKAEKLNRLSMTFSLREGAKVEHEPDGLLRAFERILGSSPADYSAAKAQQLRDLGYGAVRYVSTLNLMAESPEQLADAFLGLTSIEAKSWDFVERRFDVDLPDHSLPVLRDGMATITPDSIDKGLLSITAAGHSTVSLECEARVTPAFPDLPAKVLFRTSLFDVIFSDRGFKLAPRPDRDMQQLLLVEEWQRIVDFLVVAHCGEELTITYTRSDGTEKSRSGCFDGGHSNDGYKEVAEFLTMVDELRIHMGVEDEPFALTSLKSQSIDIKFIHSMHLKGLPFRFQSFSNSSVTPVANAKAKLIRAFPLLSRWIGVAVPVHLTLAITGTKSQWLAQGDGRESKLRLLTGDPDRSFETFSRAEMADPVLHYIVESPAHRSEETAVLHTPENEESAK